MATVPTGDSAVVRQAETALASTEVEAARASAAPHVLHTPLFRADWLSDRVAGSVTLKAENLQRTGSFKVRGALAKLARLAPRGGGGRRPQRGQSR
jgi:threonine dehydratase